MGEREASDPDHGFEHKSLLSLTYKMDWISTTQLPDLDSQSQSFLLLCPTHGPLPSSELSRILSTSRSPSPRMIQMISIVISTSLEGTQVILCEA